ncbi:hypothetical protein C8R43DRAFT_1152947 [Mycena crocata]|nr:hypothetical protein C8R43DRAFT_1152947 [Mycena crocata]
MDVDSQPDSFPTPPGACQPGTNHSVHYYWPDGSLYIRPAGTETIYRVWGSRLDSGFFDDLKSLPSPQPGPSTKQDINSKLKRTPQVEIVKKKAEESGGNGDSETTPLWIQPDAEEFEIFPRDMLTRPVAFWKKAIEMADFFDAQMVKDIAIRWLDENKGFDPFLRLELAMKYCITHWLDIGFRAIVHTHLPDLSSKQINMLGFSAYIILAETQAKIHKHRTLCALTVPPVEHHKYCSGNDSCNKAWLRSIQLHSFCMLQFYAIAKNDKADLSTLISFTSLETVLARFGVSFHNPEQECANAEEELYRASLVPANLTNENPYWESPYPFYDTFFWIHSEQSIPFSPSSIHATGLRSSMLMLMDGGIPVRNHLTRNTASHSREGFIPKCRSNTKPCVFCISEVSAYAHVYYRGYIQGGSDGMIPLGNFAVKYGSHAGELGVQIDDLYQALVDTAENTPRDWYTIRHQNTAWKQFGYIPTDWVDPSGVTGLPTREASRAWEYALRDFAVCQAALSLKKDPADVVKYANRWMNFVNMWDKNITSDRFSGFAQRWYPQLVCPVWEVSAVRAGMPSGVVGHHLRIITWSNNRLLTPSRRPTLGASF